MEKAAVPLFIERMAKRAPTFKDLAAIALDDLRTFHGKAEIVCGPISTGGYGNAVINLLAFNYAIEMLAHAGRPIWSQMPYEAGVADLEHAWKLEHREGAYCTPILEDFYRPLFDSKLIVRAWFLPQWNSSKGATWEHAYLMELDVDIRYLPTDWMYELRDVKILD